MASGEETFGARLYRLLNRPRRAKSLYCDHGTWRYTATWNISRTVFESHLRDDDCIAVGACGAGRANFLAVDIDRGFGERLAVFRDILHRRRWQRAAFGITGSSEGRGKLVVTLATPTPQEQAQRIVRELLAEAASDERFGSYGNDVSMYPTGGDGSFVRLFGRNRKRRAVGLVEVPLSLDGMLDDLVSIEPLVVVADCKVPTILTPSRLSHWAQSTLAEPFLGDAKDVYRAQIRLAGEAVGLYGAEAADKLAEWNEMIAANSPMLFGSGHRQLHRPDAIPRALAYVAAAGRERPSPRPNWRPLLPHHISGLVMVGKKQKVSRTAIRAYGALAEIVATCTLDPHAFCADFARIAEHGQFADKSDAYQAVCAAEDSRLLFRLDRGDARRGGLVTVFALVGEGEDPDDVLDSAMRTAAYQERRRIREAQAATMCGTVAAA